MYCQDRLKWLISLSQLPNTKVIFTKLKIFTVNKIFEELKSNKINVFKNFKSGIKIADNF